MCIEILTSIAGAIAGEIAKHAITPVGRLMGYPISYKSDIKIFGEKLQDLKLARKSMQDRIDEARTKGEVIEEEVLKWLNEVDEIIKDADDFLQKGAQAKTSCSGCVLRLNWGLRRRRSREAKTTKDHFEENINKGQCFHRISHPPEVDYLRNTGFEKFDTREKKMTEVLKALGDSDVRTIGVHGMAGVGKTMFAKAVARQAEKQKLITKPIFTTVSQTPNIEKMQDEIAEQLGMKLDEKSTAVRRAAYLGNRLKQENTLIVLDDIWEPLDLPKTIGICFEETQNGCKVLMTSRDQNVLGSHMEDKNIFRVELLSISETTDLFKSIVGKKIEESEFRELGTKLIEECGNLPLAVTTIAHALKPGKLHSWQNALTQLQRSSWPLISGIDAHVSKSIMWSYDFWDTNEEAKKLLLLCSLHGEDEEISVEDLMRCGVGLGLFQGINNFEEGRNMVRSLLDKLKDRCLLLSGVNHDTVKMHDVIRDVIIAI